MGDLYCLKDRGTDAAPCAVTFECNGQSGEPVTWPVEVGPKTIFSYWPNKTAPDGTDADLQAALIAAGKTEDEARRRTTCEVFSPDPLTVRGYTLFGGQPTLVPVAEPTRPDVAAEPGERRRQATLPNLSPWQAWVHLYCLKDRAGPVRGDVRVQRPIRGSGHVAGGDSAEDHLQLLAEQDGGWPERRLASGLDSRRQAGGRSPAPDDLRSVQRGPDSRAGLHAVQRATDARTRHGVLSGSGAPRTR